MGLDFRGSAAHWPYGGFNRFREKLAKEADIPPLPLMEGFFSKDRYDNPFKRLEADFPERAQQFYESLPIRWASLKKDPIHPLLYHSDCDGSLTAKECERIAPRLRILMSEWADDDNDKVQGLLLAEGMEECARNKRKLKFI